MNANPCSKATSTRLSRSLPALLTSTTTTSAQIVEVLPNDEFEEEHLPGAINIPLKELDEANAEFSRTDVSLVIGANDVVNPAARDVPDSPIYGMPILNVDESHSIIVLKRSMNTGFAGIDNPLFYNEKTALLFGDAKTSVSDVVSAVQDL